MYSLTFNPEKEMHDKDAIRERRHRGIMNIAIEKPTPELLMQR
jgi:hypothetical protein